MIRNTTAQKTANHWHGGQWSAYYQFASSGKYIIENHLRYLQETETNLHPEYNLHPGVLTKGQEKELQALKEWFIKQGEKNGIKTLFSKHPVYGYLVPYLHTDTADEIATKITSLQYAI